MIVVDTSELVAVLSGEPDGERIHEALAGSTASLKPAANDLECSLVISACFGDDGVHDLRLYLHEAGIEVVPVDRDQAASRSTTARQTLRTEGLRPACWVAG
jgi:ribonuclease VapC